MDSKIILWSVALFFGSWLVFKAIDDATRSSSEAVTFGLKVVALGVIIGAILLVIRRKRGDGDGGGD